MSEPGEVVGTVVLDVPQFKLWITLNKARLLEVGSHVHVIVLPAELEIPILTAFMKGELNGFLTHGMYRRKLREYLDGTRVMFTDRLSLGRGWFVLDKDSAPVPSNIVEPPVGPGQDPGGGTPVASNNVPVLALVA